MLKQTHTLKYVTYNNIVVIKDMSTHCAMHVGIEYMSIHCAMHVGIEYMNTHCTMHVGIEYMPAYYIQ